MTYGTYIKFHRKKPVSFSRYIYVLITIYLVTFTPSKRTSLNCLSDFPWQELLGSVHVFSIWSPTKQGFQNFFKLPRSPQVPFKKTEMKTTRNIHTNLISYPSLGFSNREILIFKRNNCVHRRIYQSKLIIYSLALFILFQGFTRRI